MSPFPFWRQRPGTMPDTVNFTADGRLLEELSHQAQAFKITPRKALNEAIALWLLTAPELRNGKIVQIEPGWNEEKKSDP